MDRPSIEVRPFTGDLVAGKWRELEVPAAAKYSFDPVLRAASALANIGVASSPLYRVWFAPDVAAGLRSGSLHIMRSLDGLRPIAVDSANRIVGQGIIEPATGYLVLGAAMAIWQILAVITAQRFLRDINHRLANIERGIQDIKTWLENDRKAKLLGNISYLRTACDRIREANLTPSDLSSFVLQIDSIERDCTQVQEAYGLEMQQKLDQFEDLPLEGMGIRQRSDDAIACIDSFGYQARGFLLAVYVRGFASVVRCGLPVSRQLAAQRVAAIGSSLEEHRRKVESFRGLVEDRLPKITSFWSNFWGDTPEFQGKVRSKADDVVKDLHELSGDLTTMIEETKRRIELEIEEESRPLEVVARADSQGTLVRLYVPEGRNN